MEQEVTQQIQPELQSSDQIVDQTTGKILNLEDKPAPKKKSFFKKLLLILILVFVFGGTAAGGYYAYQAYYSPEQKLAAAFKNTLGKESYEYKGTLKVQLDNGQYYSSFIEFFSTHDPVNGSDENTRYYIYQTEDGVIMVTATAENGTIITSKR